METHPSYPQLSLLVSKYPSTAGSLFQTYNDLLLGKFYNAVKSQQWRDLQIVDLGEPCNRASLQGRRPAHIAVEDVDALLHVVPCFMSETISLSWISDVFKALSNPESIYLAIATEDSSIVYYKLSSGIVKPVV
ncbi:hypothetical protein K435DRAFT_674626 [Dendrothele bispora CBS 962.96]|uniref:tRNA-splicing endonuclease subunit Sen15 domain-containing protein n=1 Tax=Dendrothele bispora (strain CBS 962.96) TaxID=1314807 RepID=A0A4S8LPA5_DENBC|nr:hypothetical protein K435DRAFT_674626 [Dendrothele bispora CBS 962.96]